MLYFHLRHLKRFLRLIEFKKKEYRLVNRIEEGYDTPIKGPECKNISDMTIPSIIRDQTNNSKITKNA